MTERTDQQAQTDVNGMWVDPAHDPRDTDEPAVGEKVVLRQYLDRYRMTFEMKCEGLTPEQLATRSVAPSTMSLLGLLRHLARVEHHWFRRALEGQADLARLYRTEDDPDLDFNGAVGTQECVADAWESWRGEVAWQNYTLPARYCDGPGACAIVARFWRSRAARVT